jgi:hypothetical protein
MYAIETGSDSMIYVPSFMKIGIGVSMTYEYVPSSVTICSGI